MKSKTPNNSPNPKFKMPNRRSIRLQKYDYTHTGAYFVTICTQNQKRLFGDVSDKHMTLNNAGRMVQMIWNELPEKYHGVETDAFQIMPNHVHGVVVLVGANGQPRGTNGQPRGVAPTMSLPDVVHRFKSMTTKRYTDAVKTAAWPPFPGRLWQRNYYERIIRNENELNRIRKYITGNPVTRDTDRENTNR